MVPEGIWPVCDKGVKPSQLRSLSYSETVIMGEHMCTRMDKVLAVNFDPFGACACCNGSPCTAPVIDWTHVTDKIRLGEICFCSKIVSYSVRWVAGS
ncbi:PAAR-like protein, partial [Tannerella forsythia]|uniref:PAAR-like protein n=1 Tax=Tannerella forsythia TaxID=28112 RepID=UPI00117E86F7